MNSKNYVNEKIKLATLTPIFIGSDQANDLSPITDFVIEQDKLQIINQRKFENLLSEDPNLIDKYVKQVKSGKFNLKSFIENELNSTVEELSKKTFSIQNYPGQGEIKTFVTSSGNTFIPGSTIKGAIRTSVIYNYLTQTDKGKDLVQEIFNPQIALNKLKNKQNLRAKEKKTIKNLEELIRNMPKNQFNRNNKFAYDYIYNELLLFKNQDFGHDFRHIQISDSKFIDDSETEIIQLSCEYLTKNNTNNTQWKHVVRQNIETNFQLKIVKNFKDDFLKPFNNGNYKELFKMINKFSLDVIEFELARFDEFIENEKQDKAKLQETSNGTISFYNELKERIKFMRDSCAVIRIGGGKTYFDNSIGLALYKSDKEKFKQFRKLLGFWKHRSGGFVEEDSPITRTFYYNKSKDSYFPIGWTVIYFEKDKGDIKKLFNIDEQKTEVQNHNKVKENEAVNEGELDLSKLSNLGRVTKLKTQSTTE